MEAFNHHADHDVVGPTVDPGHVKEVNLTEPWKDLLTTHEVDSISDYFTYALPGSHVEAMTYKYFESIGVNKSNTYFTESSCPDELNHDHINTDIS